MMAFPEVLALITTVDKALQLGGQAVAFACQCEPRLRTEPLPDEGAAMEEARADALERTEEK